MRKFKDESRWVDTLEINYKSNLDYSGHLDKKIVIASGVLYGHRVVSSVDHGQVEEFRVDFGGSISSFIEFSHDGRGSITSFLFGDENRIYPCQIKR